MDSLIEPEDLFKRVKEIGQSAVAVTDHGTMAGAWDALKYSKALGVKLIMGCEFYFVDDVTSPNGRMRHVILVARNHQGYQNLLALHKAGFDNFQVTFKKVIPRIDWKLLEKYSEGVICTTACGGGILAQLINTRRLDEAKIQAKRLKDIFGQHLALEIQPHAMKRVANLYKDYEDQKFTNNQLIKIGSELDIKVIAATDAHYITPDQHSSHDVMLAMGAGQPVSSGNRLKYTNDFWIRTREEVIAGLSSWANRAEEFCDNTLYFSDMCETPEWIDPKFTNPSGRELPTFPVKDQPDYNQFKDWWVVTPEAIGKREDEAYYRYWVYKEFPKFCPPGKEEQYKTQVEYELEVFEMKDLCSYMSIVSDYVGWAKSEGIPTGPGRGSAAGSLCAWMTGIHDADPIKYGLIFERFYNKAKTGLSDIDCDFGQAGKPLVEQYIIKKYGEEYCAQVSNFSTITPKPYAKAIARVFQYGGDHKTAVIVGNAIADSIPKEIHTVATSFEHAPLFAEFASTEKYHHLKKYAKDIGNKTYNLSTHAGAMIIGKRPLHSIVPVRRTKEGDLAVEYEKERAEANGLAKMDLLGLSTLDVIQNVITLIKEQGKTPPSSVWDYDANDELTYQLISSGKTYGVFQLGKSGGTIDLCKKMQPRNIEDLAMVTSLTRPGFPKDIRDDFIAAKKANRTVEAITPVLNRAFAPTFGYALFDEVLLQVAQDFAGWDLTEADRLRKFVKEKGKYPEKDRKLKNDLIKGAMENVGLTEEMANRVWDEIISNFGGYAFNKAHAVCYSFLSYQTAYLKAHFPLEFLIADLNFSSNSNTLDKDDKIEYAKNEIRGLGVKILPPDINKSEKTYKILDDKHVITGFDSMKYMGKDAIPELLEKRPFVSFEDFLAKVDGKKVKVPAIQALAASGCLDSFGMSRKQMFLYASDYKKKLQVWLKRKKKDEETFNYPWPEEKDDWSLAEKYALERYYIGEGLSANKFQAYPNFFHSSAPKFSEYTKLFPNPGTPDEHYQLKPFLAEVKGFFEFKVKKEDSKSFGKPMAKVSLEDPWGFPMMMTIFPKQWAMFKDRVKTLTGGKSEFVPGVAIYATGSLNWYEDDISIVFDDILKCAPPPAVPSDLKAKKVSMRRARSSKKVEEMDAEEILEEVEDEMVEDGFSDLNDDIFEEEPEDYGMND
jgi:DNA polymerase-3 subunit alpha